MIATFYNYSGKCNTINKHLTFIATRTFQPFNEFDIQNPFLILKYHDTVENANYCVIEGIGYFIESPTRAPANRVELRLIKDLLYTYRNGLMQCDVIIDRSTNNFNSYISDGMQKECVNFTTFSIPLGSLEFSGNSPIIIALIGGSG